LGRARFWLPQVWRTVAGCNTEVECQVSGDVDAIDVTIFGEKISSSAYDRVTSLQTLNLRFEIECGTDLSRGVFICALHHSHDWWRGQRFREPSILDRIACGAFAFSLLGCDTPVQGSG
jgi:hypothetical protein